MTCKSIMVENPQAVNRIDQHYTMIEATQSNQRPVRQFLRFASVTGMLDSGENKSSHLQTGSMSPVAAKKGLSDLIDLYRFVSI